jgi:hypothetical protein
MLALWAPPIAKWLCSLPASVTAAEQKVSKFGLFAAMTFRLQTRLKQRPTATNLIGTMTESLSQSTVGNYEKARDTYFN